MNATAEEVVAALEQHERTLVALLARLGTLDPASPALAEQLAEGEELVAALAVALPDLAAAPAPTRTRARASLERLVRWNALAQHAVATETRGVAAQLARTRTLAAGLDHGDPPPVVGDSCDMRG